jgi:ABC-type bacteriocin/lantibiotic exporter with double-glycine peptidase domain
LLIKFKYIILFVVSKIKNETKSQIEKECINIFQKKIEIRNIISRNLFADNRSYILKTKPEDRSEYFGELNIYLSNFLKKLWENPEFIFEVLLNSSIDDIKDNLSDFFINNFYENVLSQNCIENNLLYVITLSLKEEINNLINKEKP